MYASLFQVIYILHVSPTNSSMYFLYLFTEITFFNYWALLKVALCTASMCSKAKLFDAAIQRESNL
jgi:hypothetical protein